MSGSFPAAALTRESILIQVNALSGGSGGRGGATAGGTAGTGGNGEGPRIIETLIVNNHYYFNGHPPPSESQSHSRRVSPTLRNEPGTQSVSGGVKQVHDRNASDDGPQSSSASKYRRSLCRSTFIREPRIMGTRMKDPTFPSAVFLIRFCARVG
ncbi:hypothetical protein B0H12DRAFT_1099235 [Mycena haematopus]|nr:hypothetical protein B0H12DRAFT_1099235 [Mycena haematopus]